MLRSTGPGCLWVGLQKAQFGLGGQAWKKSPSFSVSREHPRQKGLYHHILPSPGALPSHFRSPIQDWGMEE